MSIDIVTNVLQFIKSHDQPIETLLLFDDQILDLALLYLRITDPGANDERKCQSQNTRTHISPLPLGYVIV